MKITVPKNASLRTHIHRVLMEHKGMWLSTQYIEQQLKDKVSLTMGGMTSSLHALKEGGFISRRPAKGVPVIYQKRVEGDQPKFMYTFEKLIGDKKKRKYKRRKPKQTAAPKAVQSNVDVAGLMLALAYEVLHNNMTREQLAMELLKAAAEA